MQAMLPALEALLKSVFQAGASGFRARVEVDHVDLEADPPEITTVSYACDQVDLDKGLRLEADQLQVAIPRVAVAPLGWGETSVFQKYSRIRAYQWYGAAANEIQTFTGLIDMSDDTRDPLRVTLSARDMMALLLDYTFSASAPQAAGEDGAVRTPANGVFLSYEISDIVNYILDVVGWPSGDRDIVATSYVIDEFVWQDGQTANEAVNADEHQLGGLAGYVAYADEFGVFHFAPSLATTSLTEPPTAAYIFRSGEDILSLADSVDSYDQRTRVKARGPLTTQVLTDEWRELWRTSKFSKPVGLWHDPTDAAHLRVLDRGTKRLYHLRQSDRVILSSVDISTIVPHPLGLSGDPADSAVYWILNAPWIDGIPGGNRAKKVRKSDNHVLLSLALPDGQISALKVSSANLYFTRLDTDRVYRRSKTTGAAVTDFRHTYNGVVQSNPSGLMIDGTTLMVFWANGGTTARFLHCEEGSLSTITKVTRTAGTNLHGGEMDTVTHTDCYGDSDSLGLVAKFSLIAVSDRTDEVYAEVVDTDLEDDLGALAQVQSRIHDTHPGDGAHPWFARRDTLDLDVITSLAQATETSARRLEILSQYREVLDAGIIGNPVLQKTDVIGVVDPVSGLNKLYSIDAYRSTMDADGTYVGTIAGIPIPDLVAENGDIEDDGSADEDEGVSLADMFIALQKAKVYGSALGYEGTGDSPLSGWGVEPKVGNVDYGEVAAPFNSVVVGEDTIARIEAKADFGEVGNTGNTVKLVVTSSVQGELGHDLLTVPSFGFFGASLAVDLPDVALVAGEVITVTGEVVGIGPGWGSTGIAATYLRLGRGSHSVTGPGTWVGSSAEPGGPGGGGGGGSDFGGGTASGILTYDGDASVLIENISIVGGTRDAPAGIGIAISNVTGSIVIRNVDLAHLVGGIYIYNCTGTIDIDTVRILNIGDGTIGSGHSNHIQIAESVLDGSIHDSKFRGGRTEDMISIWHSGGVSSGHELIVEDNQLQGLAVDADARAWTSGSGTGIIVGDGAGSANNGHVIVRNNTLLTPGAVGIQLIDGPAIEVDSNTIYGQQRPASNNAMTSWEGNPIASVHDNHYYWHGSDGSLVSPWFAVYGTVTETPPNVEDAAINPDDLVVVL